MIDSSTQAFIAAHLNDDMRKLSLQEKKYPGIDFRQAIVQIAGRQKIKDKIPSWYSRCELLLPSQLPLEQCSSESTARYKASLVKGDRLIDLTGGWGVDCAFMAEQFKQVLYFEQQPELCAIATHNFRQMGLSYIETRAVESTQGITTLPLADCIYIDPARRDTQGKKTVLLSDCTPDITNIADVLLEKTKVLLVKLSPMLDITQALKELPKTSEVHVVSVDNECKELLFLLCKNGEAERKIYGVNLKKDGTQEVFCFTEPEESEAHCTYTDTVENYLYEPNTSLLKAGAFKVLAQRYRLKKLHRNSHIYTSVELQKDFPGRIFNCKSVFSPTKSNLKTYLSDITKANITVRNFPATVAELRKKTKLKDGGEDYIFATTLSNNDSVFILCRKPEF